ncbi:MAG: winged helix-turn-helix transcriptional regulator [Candidatus Bathyarchaeota archaeon]|nr:MAG: winged helix-turn-helix transcriptional regulator [Candidatus Bathyarchaeota archaeon]
MNLLRDKGELTKFQILFEIKRKQPHVKQEDISKTLGITVQAVSKHFKKLINEGLIEPGADKANYMLTPKAIEKLQEGAKSLERYALRIESGLKIERVWPALAAQPIKAGDQVGIIMKEGIVYAVPADHSDAKVFGVATTDAKTGEDLGFEYLKGKVKVERGRILIVKLPSIKEGGSRSVDLAKVKKLYKEFQPNRIGVMGSVGRAVLNKLELKADIEFGINRAAAIAALRGLDVFVLVVGRMANRMIEEIDEMNIKRTINIPYEMKDGRKT